MPQPVIVVCAAMSILLLHHPYTGIFVLFKEKKNTDVYVLSASDGAGYSMCGRVRWKPWKHSVVTGVLPSFTVVLRYHASWNAHAAGLESC